MILDKKPCRITTLTSFNGHWKDGLQFVWKNHAYRHTYVIGYYSSSVRITDLVSYTTYVVCINFISGGAYSLKSTPNDRFFEKLFMAMFFIYSQSFCQKSVVMKSPKKYFLYFVLMSGLGLELSQHTIY